MGFAVRDSVTRSVPAIYGTVVQRQSTQFGYISGSEHIECIIKIATDKHAEASDIFLVDFRNGRLDPFGSKMHTRAGLSQVQIAASRIDRLLEERDPGFAPQALAE